MRTFFSEYTSDYTSYTFGYSYYAHIQSYDELNEAYSQWFLPYTGKLDITQDIFYFCRSLRVDISKFENTSENRRIIKKVEPLHIQVTIYNKEDFDTRSNEFEDFCIWYTQSRFYHEWMTTERFHYVISRWYANKIIEFKIWDTGQIIWYTLAIVTDTIMHHRFCFFDTELMESIPLGKYLMRYTIDRCKQQWLTYAYLWTCYKETWLYKVRDFEWVERWDGNKWSTHIEQLKNLCKSDNEIKYKDLFKIDDKNYLL